MGVGYTDRTGGRRGQARPVAVRQPFNFVPFATPRAATSYNDDARAYTAAMACVGRTDASKKRSAISLTLPQLT